MIEATLSTEIERTVKLYEDLLGERATRTRTMISNHGEVGALSRLMMSPNLQRGFKVLRDADLLSDTFEALVARFPQHFTSEVVEVATWRLQHAHELPPAQYDPL
jgi:hypothetical protein